MQIRLKHPGHILIGQQILLIKNIKLFQKVENSHFSTYF